MDPVMSATDATELLIERGTLWNALAKQAAKETSYSLKLYHYNKRLITTAARLQVILFTISLSFVI